MKLYHSIDEIVKEDKKWRNLAYKLTNNKRTGDEILHSFYIYYLEMPKPPIINYTYIYQSLYNNHVQIQLRLKKKPEQYDESDTTDDNYERFYLNGYIQAVVQDHYFYDEETDTENENLYKNIMLDIEGLEYFNRTLFKLNMIDGIPIRQISREYKLSYSTIQKSIAQTKLLLKNKYTDNEKED